MVAYGNTCAISGCQITSILEAAHVVPFRAKGADTLANGILLRIDLHRLFDADQLAIDPKDGRPMLSQECFGYISDLHPALIPAGGPAPADFQPRWKAFEAKR